MGLLDRIARDEAIALEDEHARMIQTSAEAEMIAEVRAAIIHDRFAKFADKVGEPMHYLGLQEGRTYYVVGDVVLAVRLHGHVDKEAQMTTKRNEVLWQFAYYVVGLGRSGSEVRYHVGTLRLINYQSIRKAVTSSGEGVNFDYTNIGPLLTVD